METDGVVGRDEHRVMAPYPSAPMGPLEPPPDTLDALAKEEAVLPAPDDDLVMHANRTVPRGPHELLLEREQLGEHLLAREHVRLKDDR